MFRAEHQYTEADLSFENLKGNDLAMARALFTCPGIDPHLVPVTRTVARGGESTDSGRKRRQNRDSPSDGNDDDPVPQVRTEAAGRLCCTTLNAVFGVQRRS